MLSRGVWNESSRAQPFEVLTEASLSLKCHYVRDRQNFTKLLGGQDRASVKASKGKTGEERDVLKNTKEMRDRKSGQ